jgi:hypothetical protein
MGKAMLLIFITSVARGGDSSAVGGGNSRGA